MLPTRLMARLLQQIFENPGDPAGYGNAKQLYDAAKTRIRGLKPKNVKQFSEEKKSYTLHCPVRTKFERRKVLTRRLDWNWGADLVDLGPLARENRGNKYLLTVIDFLSRFAFVGPIKTKKGSDVARAFERILLTSGRTCRKLATDRGSKFYNPYFKQLMRRRRIIHYSPHSPIKVSLIERFNRTLKSRMFKFFTEKNTLRYIEVLPQMVEAYNNRIHSSIGMKPAQVNRQNQRRVWRHLYEDYLYDAGRVRVPIFRAGDKVGISKTKQTFNKGYVLGWSNEIYRVREVLRTIPLTYAVANVHGERLKGGFYAQELTNVRW